VQGGSSGGREAGRGSSCWCLECWALQRAYVCWVQASQQLPLWSTDVMLRTVADLSVMPPHKSEHTVAPIPVPLGQVAIRASGVRPWPLAFALGVCPVRPSARRLGTSTVWRLLCYVTDGCTTRQNGLSKQLRCHATNERTNPGTTSLGYSKA
jgi:hypothetical protein